MRPAHYAREVSAGFQVSPADLLASMRPAHYAREVLDNGQFSTAGPQRFNEARALCAGSRCGEGVPRRPPRRFNEARALCAGSPPQPERPPAAPAAASMRPAHYAREVRAHCSSAWDRS